ncbi:sensor histidine kinase [Granulosicoccus antarcticus]|uniref:histidine kinase n=1 Tax=Granulosicoccus antarcticus IMCC3135 TaxID=1192854 RepID=A0A2Z2NYE9_9GAMM|nr:PAS domain-containing sensor histidine kinase [Granulosicoccus antarcticus]ASJ72174.1 Phytochrome-like protein cph1 [Granulosicoccus antarcticus IMCC3135]
MTDEQTTTHSADWYEQILDAMPDMVLVKGPKSRLLWANRTFREYYGLSNEELRQLIDGKHSDPDDTLQYVKDDHRVFQTGLNIDIPAEPITDANGTVRYMHTIKSPIHADGEVVRQVGVSRPVTDSALIAQTSKKRTESKESTESLRTLVRAMPSAVVMFDSAHRILACSEEFARLLTTLLAQPITIEELLGQDYVNQLEAILPLLSDIDATMEGMQPPRRVEAISSPGNVDSWIEIESRPWHDASGTISGSVAVLYDVTQQHLAQKELLQANDELSQFNYHVSHDLVSPITSTRGLLSTIAEDIKDAEYEQLPEMIAMAEGQLLKLSNLVNDLMVLARADTATVNATELDLAAMIHEIGATQHLDNDPDSTNDVELHLEVKTLNSDKTRITQVMTNLLSNARKFRDESEAEPRISVRSFKQGFCTVVEVSDNGLGIDNDLSHDVFTIFTRGSAQHSGHGLGLYIVKKHIDRVGGQVQITNHRKPTTFSISLPDKPQ